MADEKQIQATDRIRKIVWEGPYVETEEGRTLRAAVGLTNAGKFRAAEVSLYEEYGHSGRVSFSGESYRWDQRSFPHKEQAIFAARETVQRSAERDRRPEKSVTRSRRSAAQKYGASRALAEELPAQRRSQ